MTDETPAESEQRSAHRLDPPMYCPECDRYVREDWDPYDERFRCPECKSGTYESKDEYIKVLHATARFNKKHGYGPWLDEEEEDNLVTDGGDEVGQEQVLAETQTAGFGLANGKVVDRLLLDFDRETPAARIRRERVQHPDPMRDGDVRRETRGTMVVNPHDTHRGSDKLEIGTSHGRDRIIAEWNDHAPRAYLRHERLENGDWTRQTSWELHPAQGIEQVGGKSQFDDGELVTDGGTEDAQVGRDDLDECWCCNGLHDSYGSLCPDCDDAGCNRFTDECKSDHQPVLADGSGEQHTTHEQEVPDCEGCGTEDTNIPDDVVLVPYRPDPNQAQQEAYPVQNLPKVWTIMCVHCGGARGVITDDEKQRLEAESDD